MFCIKGGTVSKTNFWFKIPERPIFSVLVVCSSCVYYLYVQVVCTSCMYKLYVLVVCSSSIYYMYVLVVCTSYMC